MIVSIIMHFMDCDTETLHCDGLLQFLSSFSDTQGSDLSILIGTHYVRMGRDCSKCRRPTTSQHHILCTVACSPHKLNAFTLQNSVKVLYFWHSLSLQFILSPYTRSLKGTTGDWSFSHNSQI